jgi:ABC-2 type transport system permease protein
VSVPTGPVTRALAVAETTVFAAFQVRGVLGLLGAALLFPALVGAIAVGSFRGLDLLAAAESLFSALFLPVVLLLVCLVQGVSLFRTELEEDTLLYPLKRTVPRPSVVVGKYLGYLGSTLLALLPSAVLGISLAAALGTGPTVATAGLFEAIVLMTVFAVVAYGALFLLLGLLTRYALMIGLVYGFLWEAFVSLLPGPIRTWTVVYYLRGVGYQLVPSGALGSTSSPVTLVGASVGFLLLAVGCLAVASTVLRYAETPSAVAPT